MNTTDNSTTCIIQLANPDISGIGVRISFYIQIFLTSLIVYISPEEATSAVWTYLSSSLGLMIAAICEARAGTLTLYQAIEVYYLLCIAKFILSTCFSLLLYTTPSKYRLAWIIHKLQNYMYIGLSFYVWIRAATFGPGADCNSSIKFVFFFATMRALGPGRILCLTLLSLEAILNTYILHTGFTNLLPRSKEAQLGIDMFLKFSPMSPLLWNRIIGNLTSLVFLVIWNEMYIHKNHTEQSDAVWGFGQIFSLVTITPAVVAFFQVLRKKDSQESEVDGDSKSQYTRSVGERETTTEEEEKKDTLLKSGVNEEGGDHSRRESFDAAVESV